jgi:hypothetical protein
MWATQASRKATSGNFSPPRVRLMRAVLVVISIAFLTTGCSPSGTGPTELTNACAARLYSPYDSKNLKQCLDVCIRCNHGVTTTCATSCTLKGAK